MILGTPTAAATSSKGKRDPLTFNGVEIDRKTGWQTLDLQGEFADMAKAIYDAEVAFKAKVAGAIMAAALAAKDDKGRPAPTANADKHRVMLTTNYGKWSFAMVDKAAKRNTFTLG